MANRFVLLNEEIGNGLLARRMKTASKKTAAPSVTQRAVASGLASPARVSRGEMPRSGLLHRLSFARAADADPMAGLRNARDFLRDNASRFDAEPYKRLTCALDALIANPDLDDRVVRYNALWANADIVSPGMSEAKWSSIRSTYRSDFRLTGPGARPDFVAEVLRNVDEQVVKTIQWLAMQYETQGSAMSKGMVEIKDWIHDQQLSSSSIYSCYAG